MTKPITHVAIIVGDKIYSLPKPLRHGHVIRAMALTGSSKKITGNVFDLQGFLDADGIFLDRRQAYARVFEINQELTSMNTTYTSKELYSEDVWNTPGKWDSEKDSAEYMEYWNIHGDENLVKELVVADFVYPEPPYTGSMFLFDLLTHTKQYVPIRGIKNMTFSKLYSQVHKDTPVCENPQDLEELIADRVYCLIHEGEELSENQPKASPFKLPL